MSVQSPAGAELSYRPLWELSCSGLDTWTPSAMTMSPTHRYSLVCMNPHTYLPQSLMISKEAPCSKTLDPRPLDGQNHQFSTVNSPSKCLGSLFLFLFLF